MVNQASKPPNTKTTIATENDQKTFKKEIHVTISPPEGNIIAIFTKHHHAIIKRKTENEFEKAKLQEAKK